MSIIIILISSSSIPIIFNDSFYRENVYVSLQFGASKFIEKIDGAVFYYGGSEDKYYRVLTVAPFLRAVESEAVKAGSEIGVSRNLSEDKMATIATLESTPLWFGGYHYELVESKISKKSKIYYFVLPPGDFVNTVYVMSSEVYDAL